MNYGQAISYVLRSINRIPQLFLGISYYTSGGINRSISLLSLQSSHIDMRNNADRTYLGWSFMFWGSFILGLLSMVVSSIPYGGWGFLTVFLGSLVTLVASVVSLLMAALFITLGEKFKSHWNTILMKVITVLYFISVISCIWGMISAIIGLVRDFAIISLITCFISLVQNFVNVCAYGMILDAIATGSPTNYVQNQNNQFNQQNYYSQSQFNQQGQFNVQNQGLNNLGAINTNNSKSSIETQQPTQSPQMYACPFCNKPIVYGTNPCPHCNNTLNWGT